ncbi:MAG: immune inhibitor A [Bacteroidetes bacterium]|nr:immune inhibitor A [Bacteroidota bacterium]
MKNLIYCLILFFFVSQVSAQMPVYHYVRVGISPTLTVKNAEAQGVDLESSTIKSGQWIETVLPEETIAKLRLHGEKVEILINNLCEYYQTRNSRINSAKATEQTTPEHFKLGSMGGYFQLEEIYQNYADMRKFYPNAVSEPIDIGISVEKRPIYAYRFSLNNDDNKPQVLYTSVHHAREPGGASTLIYFLWDLLEKAKAGNDEAQYLLANRVIYVIPMVNPDGYLFNYKNSPKGGGLWRKNRKPNIDNTTGVDLNRNYGPMELWNAVEGGSSENPTDETFRGMSPFSEPETQAVRDFCRDNKFRIALNYHTFGNLLLYPFGNTEIESPDSLFFRSFCADGTKFNNYSSGVALQTVNYATRGSSDDWMYFREPNKSKIFSMTPEVGTPLDGFYAPPERIIPQCAENLYFNYQTAWSALTNYRIIDATPLYDQQTDQPRFSITIQNTGVEQPDSTIEIKLIPIDTRFRIKNNTRTLKQLITAEKQTETFDITIPSGYHNGDYTQIEAVWLQNGTPRHDTVRLQFFRPRIDTLYAHSPNAFGWLVDKWATMPNPEGGFMLSDSPDGDYSDSDSNFIQTSTPIDVVNARSVSLDFWTRWTIEAKSDFGVVQVSDNDGRTWDNLKSSRMKPATGTPGSKQVAGTFGFDGNFPTWVRQECSLDKYIGKQILLRFGLMSDGQGTHDGIYLRDITLRMYDDSMSGVTSDTKHTLQLEVFPSPTIGSAVYVALSKTNAQLPLNSIYTLRLFNSIGQECYSRSGEVNGGNEQIVSIPTSALVSGIYHITLQIDGQLLSGNCTIVH